MLGYSRITVKMGRCGKLASSTIELVPRSQITCSFENFRSLVDWGKNEDEKAGTILKASKALGIFCFE
jgi:microcystin degradation protein MlrC